MSCKNHSGNKAWMSKLPCRNDGVENYHVPQLSTWHDRKRVGPFHMYWCRKSSGCLSSMTINQMKMYPTISLLPIISDISITHHSITHYGDNWSQHVDVTIARNNCLFNGIVAMPISVINLRYKRQHWKYVETLAIEMAERAIIHCKPWQMFRGQRHIFESVKQLNRRFWQLYSWAEWKRQPANQWRWGWSRRLQNFRLNWQMCVSTV